MGPQIMSFVEKLTVLCWESPLSEVPLHKYMSLYVRTVCVCIVVAPCPW